jgi:hypothetical protein
VTAGGEALNVANDSAQCGSGQCHPGGVHFNSSAIKRHVSADKFVLSLLFTDSLQRLQRRLRCHSDGCLGLIGMQFLGHNLGWFRHAEVSW